jgi:hypothetical protein
MKNTRDDYDDCTQDWSIPHSGDKKYWPMYPDGNSTYWHYAIVRHTTDKSEFDDRTGLKFEGEFSHARFQSFTVYDDDTGKALKALRDTEIYPDSDNENPYWLNVDRNTPNRKYTIAVVPEGSVIKGINNVLEFSNNVKNISIWLRMYLPDQDIANEQDGASGGVPLPGIRAFNIKTEAPAHCPQKPVGKGITINPPDLLPPANTDGKVLFYRMSFSDIYPNKDNAYLASLFDSVNDKVAVVRFRPPTFPDTFNEQSDVILEEKEVRYWSLNVGGAKITNTIACLADYEAKVAGDGFVYIVLGRKRPAVTEKTEALEYNFLPWGGHADAVVIYRNLAINSNFAGGADKIDLYENTGVSADQKLHEYAPIGILYDSVEEFLTSYDESSFDAPASSAASLPG